MSIAAILAFVSTGNAGLLAASRDPLAMGKDELLPKAFARVSKSGVPAVSIITTTVFMICVILFLDLDNFVKTASALKLFLFILANLGLIFMREGNIRHYNPRFIAPFYPGAQIIGIVTYSFLFLKMGKLPVLFVFILIIFSLIWYFGFAHGKIKREYAVLHIVERITGIKKTDRLLDEELREIIIERDDVTRSRFIKLIQECPLADIEKSTSIDNIIDIVVTKLSSRLNVSSSSLLESLKKHNNVQNAIIKSGVACLALKIGKRNKFQILLIRDKEGITFQKTGAPVHAGFAIISSKDEWVFQFHVLSWIVEIATSEGFEQKWLDAGNTDELRNLLITILLEKESEVNK
jgi:mannitol/fructose-specific phosphotransferase system IIA component (Ntr-type)